MASHSAFKIHITRENYVNFFATIRAGGSPERLADQMKTELGPIRRQFPGQAYGEDEKSDWSPYFRPRPAGLPACDLPSEKL